MALALVPAYTARFGVAPDRETAELLLALLFLENANGQAVIEHNWGNISVFAADNVDYWRPPWFDIEKISALPEGEKKSRYLNLHARMVAHQVPSAFRAFPDDATGIRVWLANVKPSMYEAAATGDPMAFAHAYWASGYCPDQACKESGPTYRKLQDEIRKAGYFSGLAPAKKGGAVLTALPSLPLVPSPSALSSFGKLSASGGAMAEPGTREAFLCSARRELALVEAGTFSAERVKAYWADVLRQSPNLPHPPHWCGAFALFNLHQAALGLALFWRFETQTDKRSGFLYALSRVTAKDVRPGDLGYQHVPAQHHFIVEQVDGEKLFSIDGNAGTAKPIQRVARRRSDPALAFYSLKRLLKADP